VQVVDRAQVMFLGNIVNGDQQLGLRLRDCAGFEPLASVKVLEEVLRCCRISSVGQPAFSKFVLTVMYDDGGRISVGFARV